MIEDKLTKLKPTLLILIIIGLAGILLPVFANVTAGDTGTPDICTVEVTSEAAAGLIILTDANGETIDAASFISEGTENLLEPVTLYYDKTRNSLASVRLIPDGYKTVTVPASNPDMGHAKICVTFHLSKTDDTAGFADVMTMPVPEADTISPLGNYPIVNFILVAAAVAILLRNPIKKYFRAYIRKLRGEE